MDRLSAFNVCSKSFFASLYWPASSSACASAIAAITQNYCVSPVNVQCDGGDLSITYQNNKLILSGSYQTVFEGKIKL